MMHPDKRRKLEKKGWKVGGAEKFLDRGTNWIQTYTGRKFYPLDPYTEDVCLEDIAHSLAHQCRYTGHCNYFYSVAQHSVLVAQTIEKWGYDKKTALCGLMHDASEAYIVDVPRPIKPFLTNYIQLEEKTMNVIKLRFDLPMKFDECVKRADSTLLNTERRDLMNDPQDWTFSGVGLLDNTIMSWSANESKASFLTWFKYYNETLLSDTSSY